MTTQSFRHDPSQCGSRSPDAAWAELVSTPGQLARRVKWKRLRAAPWTCLMRRLGLAGPPADWLAILQNAEGWPRTVRSAFLQLPHYFVTDWSLAADSGVWLYHHIRRSAYQTLVECGCGLSSLLIGLALRDRNGAAPARCYCLEHDPKWQEQTRHLLHRLDLDTFVQPIHAPLVPAPTPGDPRLTYDMSDVPRQKIEFLLIDGPPRDVGRAAVVPSLRSRLSETAVVVLDDATRRAEQECCRQWTRTSGLRLRGFLPLGLGLAVLTARPGWHWPDAETAPAPPASDGSPR